MHSTVFGHGEIPSGELEAGFLRRFVHDRNRRAEGEAAVPRFHILWAVVRVEQQMNRAIRATLRFEHFRGARDLDGTHPARRFIGVTGDGPDEKQADTRTDEQ